MTRLVFRSALVPKGQMPLILVMGMVLTALALPAEGQSRARRRRPTPPAPPAASPPATPRATKKDKPAPTGSPQPAKVELAVFSTTMTMRDLAEFDLDRLIRDQPSVLETLERLDRAGQDITRIMMRLSKVVDLREETSVRIGERRPSVQNVTVNREGRVTPSVSYEEIGGVLDMRGAWREDEPGVADIEIRTEYSDVASSAVEVASGVQLPAFVEVMFEEHVVARAGEPRWLLMAGLPTQGQDPDMARVTVARLVVSHVPGFEPAEVAHRPQMLISCMLIDVTGESETMAKLDGRALAGTPWDQNAIEAALKPFGEFEVLSRPTLLAESNQPATVSIGERAPMVTAVNIDKDGKQQAEVEYMDLGLELEMLPRWIEAAANEEGERVAELQVELQQRRLMRVGASASAVPGTSGSPTQKLPAMAVRGQKQRFRTKVPTGRVIWLMGDAAADKGGKDSTSRLIIGLRVQAVEPPAGGDAGLSHLIERIGRSGSQPQVYPGKDAIAAARQPGCRYQKHRSGF